MPDLGAGSSDWFDALADALIEWVDSDDLIPGGWDASPVMQTATAILALREGFGRAGSGASIHFVRQFVVSSLGRPRILGSHEPPRLGALDCVSASAYNLVPPVTSRFTGLRLQTLQGETGVTNKFMALHPWRERRALTFGDHFPMARHQRVQHRDAFAPQGDFNEQLYLALKQSPWWMISILLHVAVFFIASLFANVKPPPPPKTTIQASHQEEFEEELPETEEDTEEVHEQETVAEEPVIKDEEIADHPRPTTTFPTKSPSVSRRGTPTHHSKVRRTTAPLVLVAVAAEPSRAVGGGRDLGTGGGGKRKFDDAVDDALKWLAAHQAPTAVGKRRPSVTGATASSSTTSPRSPAVSAKPTTTPACPASPCVHSSVRGYTNRGKHPFARVVGKGLRYLKKKQDAEGCFGPRSTQQYTYNHATCSLAMVEAYGMTGSAIYKSSAQKCLDFIALLPQSLLRVEIRHSHRRERHLGNGLDDDGAQECQPDQQVRHQAWQAPTPRLRRVGL